jgi:hypothetical protein
MDAGFPAPLKIKESTPKGRGFITSLLQESGMNLLKIGQMIPACQEFKSTS